MKIVDTKIGEESMSAMVRRVDCTATKPAAGVAREWLVTNGLSGYASGTIDGIVTRRYHGLLVAALPAPIGRLVMLSHAEARVSTPSGRVVALHPPPPVEGTIPESQKRTASLTEFRLELGMPVWRFETGECVIERRVLMPHGQNTVHVSYHLLEGSGPFHLELRPYVMVRHYESPVTAGVPVTYSLTATDGAYEIHPDPALPTLRLRLHGADTALTIKPGWTPYRYLEEQARGYDFEGDLWCPGHFHVQLGGPDGEASGTLVASTETWDALNALTPAAAENAERSRRAQLLELAPERLRSGLPGELIVAADQFIVSPGQRPRDEAQAEAAGIEARTVIAGYHWFTDWGRDTMISLEGLTLVTGRAREAAYILRTFANYVRDGLIPNMFPDGEREGLYHTADATLWFFHAVSRYLSRTGDRALLTALLPTLCDIIEHHVRGTRFGIRVDPRDGLLVQGQENVALTWMDANVEGWVVTPRRGKAVEINALFYNALKLLERWLQEEGGEASRYGDRAETLRASFNRRFWYEDGGYLYDVVDGEHGDDPSCRPNQVLAVSLEHPVLDAHRWQGVVDVVRARLLTPYGLRSLAPGHADYRPQYYGDLRARDAAYHQGTVWVWPIGPYIDACLRVSPEDTAATRDVLRAFDSHLSEAGIGTISEIFDAEAPFTPRGCVAQAWSVAEVLRVWDRLSASQ